VSNNLYWRPVPKEVAPPGDLPDGLRFALARRLWDHDGSLRGDTLEVGPELRPYLEGLADGRVEGAGELLAAIKEHGQVLIWIAE
jgi:hypothetical protein